ncbi:MAG TPA: DUF2127 domain-containing protein [Myxococcales bacterium]
MKRPVGLEAIILYKLVKAVAEAGLGGAALWFLLRGAEAGAATLAEVLLEHFTGAWALRAATLVVRAGTSTHVKFVAAASFADAALSAVEGLSLRAGRWWGPWLVVVATGSLLPWEVWEILRRPTWGRALILTVNIAVVAYLLRGVVREHRALVHGRRPVDRQAQGP